MDISISERKGAKKCSFSSKTRFVDSDPPESNFSLGKSKETQKVIFRENIFKNFFKKVVKTANASFLTLVPRFLRFAGSKSALFNIFKKDALFRSFSLRNENVHLGLCFPWLKSTKSAKKWEKCVKRTFLVNERSGPRKACPGQGLCKHLGGHIIMTPFT